MKIKECFNNTKLGSIIALLYFVFWLLLTYETLQYKEFLYALKISLLFLIPLFFYIIMLILTNYFIKKKYTKTIYKFTTIILTFLTIIYVGTLSLAQTAYEVKHPEIDISKYNQYYKNNKNLQKGFPNKIPENASNIKFIYQPKFLQGGTTYNLYYVDETINLERFNKIYKDKSEWIGKVDDYSEKEGLLAGIFNYMNIEYEQENDFIIYIIESSCDDSGYCNHGELLLAAINEETKEVFFEYSDW